MSDSIRADVVPVTPKQLGRILQSQIPSGEPLFVWGEPGIGKSQIMHQTAAKMNLRLLEIRAPLYKPEDFVGLPWREGNKTRFCPPTFLPDETDTDGGILFIDELGQAEPSTQKVFMQLCLDKRIGEFKLPDGWFVTAASNRAIDRAGVSRVITPLLDRFVHFDLAVSVDEWLEWAAQEGVPAVVRGFIAFRRELLLQFNPALNQKAFATPRGWQKVGRLLKGAHEDDLFATVAGKVGTAAGGEFCGFYKNYESMPSLDEIIKKPSTHPIPTEASVMWSVCSALADKCKGGTPQVVAAVGTFFCRLDAAFCAYGLRSTVVQDRRILAVPAVGEWYKKNYGAMMS